MSVRLRKPKKNKVILLGSIAVAATATAIFGIKKYKEWRYWEDAVSTIPWDH